MIGIYWPRELPCWLLDSHEGQDEEIYARTQVDFGSARLRRLYTRVPHVRKAALFLHGNAREVFHRFFENDLHAGARRFIAPFREIGGADRYYECEFVEPYKAEFVLMANAERGWKVSCSFRLYGDGYEYPPYLEPAELSGDLGVHLQGRGAVAPTAHLTGAIAVRLRGRAGAENMGGGAISLALRAQRAERSYWRGAMILALAGRVAHV